jgi:hypothetical protein
VDAVGGEQPPERQLDPLPDADLGRVDIGQLDRQPAAAVEVDHREHDRRRRRVGEPVDRERHDGAGGLGHRPVAVVGGGRGQVDGALAALRADEAELPVRGPGRRRRRGPGRLGAPGRLDRQEPPPGQRLPVRDRAAAADLVGHRAGVRAGLGAAVGGERVRRPEDQHVSAVGQDHQRQGLPGLGVVESGSQQQGRVGGTGETDGGGEPVPSRVDLLSDAQLAGEPADGPGLRPGDQDLVDLVGDEAGALEGVLPGPLADGQVAALAEALLPQLGPRVARGAPAVEELLGDARLADQVGEQALALPHEQGRTGVAAGRLVGAAREPGAHVGRHDQGRPRAGQARPQRTHGRPDRAVGVEGRHRGVEPQRGVDGGGVGLVGVGRGDGREPQGGRARRAGRAPQGDAGRLDAHRRGVLVVGRHGASALAAPGARHRTDLTAVEPPVGQVDAVAQDPSARHAIQATAESDGSSYFSPTPAVPRGWHSRCHAVWP